MSTATRRFWRTFSHGKNPREYSGANLPKVWNNIHAKGRGINAWKPKRTATGYEADSKVALVFFAANYRSHREIPHKRIVGIFNLIHRERSGYGRKWCKMAQYKVTEIRMYECSCDTTVRYTEKEIKIHAKSHKQAGDKVVLEPLSGYSFET